MKKLFLLASALFFFSCSPDDQPATGCDCYYDTQRRQSVQWDNGTVTNIDWQTYDTEPTDCDAVELVELPTVSQPTQGGTIYTYTRKVKRCN